MPTHRWIRRSAARLLWATRIVDWLYGRFDGLRTRVALRWRSTDFVADYNEVAYGNQDRYRPDTESFQAELYPFEQRALTEFFPEPPASILIGGCGGGREAGAFARRGYRVVAFDPVRSLVAAMAARFGDEAIEPLVGGYDELPTLRALSGPDAFTNLDAREPFDAAVFGWGSFSNIPTDGDRVEALRRMAAVCDGPVLLSYFPHSAEQADAASRQGSFALPVGYFRDLTEAEIIGFIRAAALEPLALRHDTGWPYAVLRRSHGR